MASFFALAFHKKHQTSFFVLGWESRSSLHCLLPCVSLQMKTQTALWTTGTATIAVKPAIASRLLTTAHHSPMLRYTSIPSATSTAAPETSIHTLATAKTRSIPDRELSGVCLLIIIFYKIINSQWNFWRFFFHETRLEPLTCNIANHQLPMSFLTPRRPETLSTIISFLYSSLNVSVLSPVTQFLSSSPHQITFFFQTTSILGLLASFINE